jgi:hypothetical protein
MASNREYPRQRCENPDCLDYFTPYDRRMKFCTAQCRTNFHNDQRREKELTRYGSDRDRRHADQLLEVLFDNVQDQNDRISEEVLDALSLDYEAGIWEKNIDTGGFILWFYAYGIERIDEHSRHYTIHLRTITHNHD